MIIAVLLAASLLQAGPDAATCDSNIKLEAWGGAKAIDGEIVPIGKRSIVALKAADKVSYVLAPARTPMADSNGAVLHFTVVNGGVYKVGLSSAAWVDVISAGKPVKPVGAPQWTECAAIRKSISFQLAPGEYTLQLSGVKRPMVGVVITS